MNALSTVPSWVDRTLYPFEPHPVAGLSTVDRGTGDPWVLIHGTPSWSFEWRHVIEGLADSHRVLAPDHRGFGLSADLTGDATPEGHASRLLAWFDALDLEDVTLVLHDFGGPIGLPLALDRPERVRRVVLTNTWAWPLARWDTRLLSWVMRTPLGRWLYLSQNVSPRWILPSAYGDRSALTPEIHRHFVDAWPPHRRDGALVLAQELTGSDAYYASLERRLDELADRDVLLLWGMADPAFGAGELATWRRHCPHAAVVELAGAGHFPQEERPEAFVRALLAWSGDQNAPAP